MTIKNMMSPSMKTVLMVMLFLMLAGCGFHLRQTIALPVFAQKIYLHTSSPYSTLSRQLKVGLRNVHAELVDDPKNARLMLNIVSEHFLAQPNSLASSQQTRSYQLVYNMTYSVQTKDGYMLVDPRTLAVQNSLVLFPNEQIAGNAKIDQAKEWMEQDLVTQLTTQLAALQDLTSPKKAQRKIL